MKLPKKVSNFFILFAFNVWVFLIAVGLVILWNYETAPGKQGVAATDWPDNTQVRLSKTKPTLLMFAHPHCPCTRASIYQLSRIMTYAKDKVSANVLFFKPTDFSDDWVKTDQWYSAAEIPGVSVFRDDGGEQSKIFGSATSGQVYLYDINGRLIYSGGITSSRGSSGDNIGASAVISLLTSTDGSVISQNPVFGCPLNENRDVR